MFLPDRCLFTLAELSQESLESAVGLLCGLLETFVLSELLKHLAYSEKRLTLGWGYRTQSNIEVDFVLENSLGNLAGMESRLVAR